MVTPAFEHSSLSVEGNTLTANSKRLAQDDQGIFSAALQELMASDHSELVLDLSSVEYMSSSYLVPIAAAMEEANDGDRGMTILVGQRTASLLEIAGAGRFPKVRVVPH